MKNKFQFAMTLAVILAMLVTSLALADNLNNDVASSGIVTITAGDSTTITYHLVGNKSPSGDPKDCDATVANSVNVTITKPDAVSGSTSFSFTDCGPANSVAITFASNTPGTYNIAHSISGGISDSQFNNNADFTLVVNAVTPTNHYPTLTLPDDITAEATSADGVGVTFDVTADDEEDGELTPTCEPASDSTFPFGITQVDCSVTDSDGATTTGMFNITVEDNTVPDVTVPADITAEATGPSGADVDFSVSAYDLVDGALTPTCDYDSGSTFALDTTTTVTCSATDAAGNTGSASFDITAVDKTPPAVTVPAGIIKEATGPSGAAVTFSTSASDLVDGAITPTCDYASGLIFPLDTTTTVTCTATDAHSNTGSASFTVAVVDTTPPTIDTHADVGPIEATGPSGAVVNYTSPATHDLVDGNGTATCAPASGSTFALGDTTVTCNAKDVHNNVAAPITFKVTVVDTTPPTLTLPANMTVPATSPAGAVVTFSASAEDLVDGSVPVICSPASGSTFALGVTTVNCSATDTHGNTVSGSFTVWVKYQLSGFYSPVDMNGVFNVVKGGSTIPLKFEVFAGTTELTATSVIKSFVVTKVTCDGTATFDDIELTTTGGTSLRYDMTAGQFIQNWQTPKTAGVCYRVTMTTQDGSFLTAFFKLK